MTFRRSSGAGGRGILALAALLALSLPGALESAESRAEVSRRVAGPPACPPGIPGSMPVPADTSLVQHSLEGLGEADYQWSIRPLGGSATTLEEHRGKVLFIHMWATWCEPCVTEMGGIQALRDSLEEEEEEDIVFLLVSPEESRAVHQFRRMYGFDLPFFLEVQEMPDAFGLEALPTTFIVDRAGRIVLKRRGAANWDQDEVRRFLRGLAGR